MQDAAALAAHDAAQAHAQALADTAAQAATYGGAAAAVASHGLSLPEWASIVSMTVAILGFLLQLWLAVRRIKMENRHHENRFPSSRFTGDLNPPGAG